MESKTEISIYDYFDYRKFCADFFLHKKSLNQHFSHRLFANKAHLTSCGYFSEVVSGIRNLSRNKIANFAEGLELKEREKAYFEILVAFNHAKTNQAKRTLYDQLIRALPQKIQQLKLSQMEYFSKWYFVAVREALSICDIGDDFHDLSARLLPGITPGQVKSAMQMLKQMGLIEKDGKGFWRAKHATLLPGRDESADILVRTFQAEMMDKAKEALDNVPPAHRDISTSTLSISPEGMKRVKAAIEDFQAVVRKIVQSDKGEDRVMQFNLQLFPLTRIKEEDAQTGN